MHLVGLYKQCGVLCLQPHPLFVLPIANSLIVRLSLCLFLIGSFVYSFLIFERTCGKFLPALPLVLQDNVCCCDLELMIIIVAFLVRWSLQFTSCEYRSLYVKCVDWQIYFESCDVFLYYCGHYNVWTAYMSIVRVHYLRTSIQL